MEDKGKMDQIYLEYVMFEINNIFFDDVIYMVDMGMMCVWGVCYLQVIGKCYMLGFFNYGFMVNVLLQVIGVVLVCLDR